MTDCTETTLYLKGGEEKLAYYPKVEGCEVATVTIGHMDFRARFDFDTDAEAQVCYAALLQVVEMDIN